MWHTRFPTLSTDAPQTIQEWAEWNDELILMDSISYRVWEILRWIRQEYNISLEGIMPERQVIEEDKITQRKQMLAFITPKEFLNAQGSTWVTFRNHENTAFHLPQTKNTHDFKLVRSQGRDNKGRYIFR